jgi:hypothetical protein
MSMPHQLKGSMWQYINSTTIPSEAAAGMVYTYPDENWKEKPILIIHISQGAGARGRLSVPNGAASPNLGIAYGQVFGSPP